MRYKVALAFLLAVLGVTVYAANVLATPATGFSGTTLAQATYGDILSHVLSRQPGWAELIVTQRRVRPLRAAEHVATRRPHRLAHASGAELRDRHAGERDRVRQQRPPVHAARLHGGDGEQRVRRSGRRARAHPPKRDRRGRPDDRGAAHPGGLDEAAGRCSAGQLPLLERGMRAADAATRPPPPGIGA